MNVTFYIRKGAGAFIVPYVLINIDRKRTKTGFSSDIKILPSEWNAKTKSIKNNQRNLELQNLKDRLYQIYNVHQFSGQYITAEQLKAIFMAERKARYLPAVPKAEQKISDLLNAFLAHKKAAFLTNIITKSTLANLKYIANTWLSFFEQHQIKPSELNRSHLKAYLIKKGKTSTKKVHIRLLKQVYDFAKSEKLISNFEFPNYEMAKVFFDNKPMDSKDLEVILRWQWSNDLANRADSTPLPTSEKDDWQGKKDAWQGALDLFKIQIFTGLAWIDTQNFDCEKHIKLIKKQTFVVIKRQKTQRKTERESVVPIFAETREIMNRYGGNFPKINYHVYNKALKVISKLLKINDLVSHKARKTATYYLTTIKGYARDLVRIMLGHSSDAMADQHYFDAEKYLEGKL